MITDIAGLRVGHWTDAAARTGCTVVLFPDGTVASGEVRGGAPATRDFELLAPARTVSRIDAVVLTGGSAFGLAAADGVMRFCEERGRGFVTPAGPVPIVVALGLFDLAVGDPSVRPGAEQGYAACEAATEGPIELGAVGAGTGATVAKLDPSRPPRSGGLVSARAQAGDLRVAALVVVNAVGTPGGDDAAALNLAATQDDAWRRVTGTGFGNTTVGLLATNARLDKLGCHLVAQGAHDGLARALFPAHTRGDGDAFVAAATGDMAADVDVDVVRALAVHVVAQAIGSLAD
ncbi:MAG TPA: P1 family peptidase [Acidimicrobiales bacterium]|jgi:L-aminopeptidase/D-esterase-like protein|nr:P1 family peptidase [Acidimicrobiales bacterium]